ncbi:MAG: PTS sugar transporter subunit IIA [Candidatus Zixiibacteriota bacterium]
MVRLSKYLSEDLITDIDADSKFSAIEEMISLISSSEHISDIDEFAQAIKDRENILSTGIGLSVAVPHAKGDHVNDFVVALGRSFEGIDYDSIDGKPVNLIFMIAGPAQKQKIYLKILAKISLIARNEELKKEIISAKSKEEIFKVLSKF